MKSAREIGNCFQETKEEQTGRKRKESSEQRAGWGEMVMAEGGGWVKVTFCNFFAERIGELGIEDF